MPYGTQFTSFNALKRRMAASSESVSPGFIAMIASVNETNKTVDCLVQGSPYYLRGVRYATTFEERPVYIKERGIVYIRRSTGNKMLLEVEGPAHTIPTITAIDDQLPELPTPVDSVLEGLELRPSAFPGMSVSITTGKARFSGVITDFLPCKVGESHNAKVDNGAAPAPGIPKVGNLHVVGRTYCYLKVDAASSLLSGLYRYDQFELGPDLIVDYRKGTAAEAPVLQPAQVGHLVLGTILVRPGATKIFWEDLNTTIGIGGGTLFAPTTWSMGVPSSVIFSVGLFNQDTTPISGEFVSISFKNAHNQFVASPSAEYGSLNPYPGVISDVSGIAQFTYDNTGATKSTRIEMIRQATGARSTITVYNTSAGTQLPF